MVAIVLKGRQSSTQSNLRYTRDFERKNLWTFFKSFYHFLLENPRTSNWFSVKALRNLCIKPSVFFTFHGELVSIERMAIQAITLWNCNKNLWALYESFLCKALYLGIVSQPYLLVSISLLFALFIITIRTYNLQVLKQSRILIQE